MQKNAARVPRPPRFLNDLHFSTGFETEYYAAVVILLCGPVFVELEVKKYQKFTKKSTNSHNSTLCSIFTTLIR